jgi:hypothetical protein
MQLESAQQRLQSLEGALSSTSRDLSCFADNVGGVIAAARQATAPGSASSYLSALLAPGQLGGSVAAASSGGGGGIGGALLAPQAAWVRRERAGLMYCAVDDVGAVLSPQQIGATAEAVNGGTGALLAEHAAWMRWEYEVPCRCAG